MIASAIKEKSHYLAAKKKQVIKMGRKLKLKSHLYKVPFMGANEFSISVTWTFDAVSDPNMQPQSAPPSAFFNDELRVIRDKSQLYLRVIRFAEKHSSHCSKPSMTHRNAPVSFILGKRIKKNHLSHYSLFALQ